MCRFALFLCLLPFCVASQVEYPMGSRSGALAHSSVTLADVWAYYHNPGALGELDYASVGLSYENRFLLKELQSQALVFAMPMRVGVISVGTHFYGYRQFRSQRIGAGYSLKLADKLYAGVQLNYQGLQLNENYGHHTTATAEGGVQALINPHWRIGIGVSNIGRAKLNDYQDERYPTHFRIGTSYQLSSKVLFLLEGSKAIHYKERIKVGVEYLAAKDFFIRLGVSNQPIEFSFGFGYQWKYFSFDISSAYHQDLGWSPQISISYRFTNKLSK